MTERKTKKRKKKKYDFTIYTDGGCEFNPGGRGGCAAVIIDEKTKERTELTDSYLSTTNNRMEIMAAIIGMRSIGRGTKVKLYTDSQYLLKCFTGEWSKKKNTDLWNKLDKASSGKKVKMIWVKGHAGNKWNERCDSLAKRALKCAAKEDRGYIEEQKKSKEKSALFRDKIGKIRKENQLSQAMNKIFVREKDNGVFVPDRASTFAQKHKINLSCARSIIEFYLMEKRGFQAYASIKVGGRDYWSTKTTGELEEQITNDQLTTIKTHIEGDKNIASCIRWYMRGLLLKDAIRKALIDEELSNLTK